MSQTQASQGQQGYRLCDRDRNIIAPFATAPDNRNESPSLYDALPRLTKKWPAPVVATYKIQPSVGTGPATSGPPQGDLLLRHAPEHSREPAWATKQRAGAASSTFDPALFEERFRAIKRVFAAKDRFRSLLLRFKRISDVPYALKTLAYTIINLQNHCRN